MGEQNDPGEIVVRGRALVEAKKIYDQEGNFSLANWFYNRQYGPNTNNPDPYNVNKDDTLPPTEIVSRACESLALAIETITNAARPLLPAAEARRLDALTATLKRTALGLKTGQLDMATARSLVQTSLTLVLGEAKDAVIGLLFGAIGSWIATYMPNLLAKAIAIGGAGAAGLALKWYIDEFGAAEAVASALTNGLFDGAEAFSRAFNGVMKDVYDAFEGRYRQAPQEMNFDLRGTPAPGGGEMVTLFREGAAYDLVADATRTVTIPAGWTTGGNPKSPWNDDTPI